MNKKILGSAVAMVAVLALVGGGTFALFSDQQTLEDNTFAAGTVELELRAGQTPSNAAAPFSVSNVAPSPAWDDWQGDTSELDRAPSGPMRKIYVARNVGSINANLSMRLTNINTVPDPSDFANQIYLAVGEDPDDRVDNRRCHPFDFGTKGLVNATDHSDVCNLDDPRPLTDVVDIDWLFPTSNPLEPFDPDEHNAACVRIDAHFPGQEPGGALDNNNVQGHVLTFDTQFDLIQDN
jgi:predicted ribosomally synthesized peptide with SipW-like signal peptide